MVADPRHRSHWHRSRRARGLLRRGLGRLTDLRNACRCAECTCIQPRDEGAHRASARRRLGELVLRPHGRLGPEIVAAFEKQYPGITVNVTSNSGAFVQSQFTTEAQAGDVHADDLSVGYSSIFPQIYQAGYTLSMNQVISGFDKEYPQGFLEGNGITGIWTATPNGFAYNTKLVPAADRPTTWTDLENPVFKGHIVTPDPNDSITYLQIWDFLDKTLGTAGAKKVVANLQRTEATGFPTELASVASGSAWVAVMAGQATVAPLVAGGAPLAYVVPTQVTGSAYANAVTKNAPHPAAARLFAYWLYSAAGQKAVGAITTGGGPLVPNSLPSDFVLPNFNAAADAGKINSLLGISS